MGNELSIHDEALVSIIENKDIGDLVRPMIREIHLFDSFVAGTSHLQDPAVLQDISVGDKLILQREQSKFDDNAIQVLTEDRRRLGYIPEKDNVIFARLLDAGKILMARTSKITLHGSYTEIAIGIYLVDL